MGEDPLILREVRVMRETNEPVRKICGTCGDIPPGEAPVCTLYGYPMEVSYDYSCDMWYPRKQGDNHVDDSGSKAAQDTD